MKSPFHLSTLFMRRSGRQGEFKCVCHNICCFLCYSPPQPHSLSRLPQPSRCRGQTFQRRWASSKAPSNSPGGSDDSYVVSGTQAFDGWFMSVDTLTFKSDAKLVFSGQALNARNSYFIVARRIVVEDPTHPGVITWAKGDTASSPVPVDRRAVAILVMTGLATWAAGGRRFERG